MLKKMQYPNFSYDEVDFTFKNPIENKNSIFFQCCRLHNHILIFFLELRMEYSMKLARYLVVAVMINILMLSCQDPEVPEQDAVKMTKEELKNTIGYEWFNGHWNLYQPDSTVTEQMNLAFDSTQHKFVLFIEPSCKCRELVKESAHMVKSLDVAGISPSFYEIYSMGGIKSKHPYADKLTIKSLPQLHFLHSGNFAYSILDTFNYYEQRNKFKKIETIILDALQNY